MKALPQGQYVKHFQYGVGLVTRSDGERTTIEFDQHGAKKFVTSLLAVELLAKVHPIQSLPKRSRKTTVRPGPPKPASGAA